MGNSLRTRYAGTRPKKWRCPACKTVVGLTANTASIWCFCTTTPTMTTPLYMEPFDFPQGDKEDK